MYLFYQLLLRSSTQKACELLFIFFIFSLKLHFHTAWGRGEGQGGGLEHRAWKQEEKCLLKTNKHKTQFWISLCLFFILLSGFLGFAVREMSVWQLINASPIGIFTSFESVSHPPWKWNMKCVNFADCDSMRCVAMRCAAIRSDAISIRFAYRETNTWLSSVSSRCVWVCVYFGRCPLLMVG